MFALILASGVVIGAPALRDDRKEDAPPAARWEVESYEFDGFAFARAPVTLTRRLLEFNFPAVSRGEGHVVAWKASFFRVAEGRQVEMVRTEFERAATTIQKGIWKVEGDRLMICLGEPGRGRPTEYAGASGSGQTLIVLVRIGD
jgi:hypothetical protein